MVIDLTGVDNIVNDFVGNISGVKIYALSLFHTIADKVFSLIKELNYVEILIETLPSEILLKQIFNEKIKIGKLIIDIRPNILIANSEVIRVLKEWDLLLHQEPIAKEYAVIAYERDSNTFTRISYPDPEVDVLGKLAEKELREDQRRNSIKTYLNHREAIRLLRENKVDAAVLYRSEAKVYGLKFKQLNSFITIHLGLFKNADRLTINVYETLRNNLKGILRELGIETL